MFRAIRSFSAPVIVASLVAMPAWANAQATPDALPPIGGPGVYRDGGQLTAALRAAAESSPALATSRILITDRAGQKIAFPFFGAEVLHHGDDGNLRPALANQTQGF